MASDTSDIPLDRTKLRGRSRCDLCGKRIGPARYALGLCPGCELVVDFARAELAISAMYQLLRTPGLIERIEATSKGFADALRLVMDGIATNR